MASMVLVLNSICAGNGLAYGVRVTADLGFSNIRLPFSSFRPVQGRNPVDAAPTVDPAAVTRLSIRYEPRLRPLPAVVSWEPDPEPVPLTTMSQAFRLEVDRIKVGMK